MTRSGQVFGLIWVAGGPALAQVELGVTQVDASALGADYVTADVFIDVPDEADWWTVGGISGAPVASGVEQHVVFDPNDGTTITAPGRESPEREFASFVSVPREQFSNKRFGPNGAAAIAGGYLAPSDTASYDFHSLNIAFLQFPPSPDGADVPDFGFIARVTLRNFPAQSGFATEDIFVAASPAPGILLAEYQVASATRDHPAPLSEFTFGFYAIPEPASLALLILAAGAAPRYAVRRANEARFSRSDGPGPESVGS